MLSSRKVLKGGLYPVSHTFQIILLPSKSFRFARRAFKAKAEQQRRLNNYSYSQILRRFSLTYAALYAQRNALVVTPLQQVLCALCALEPSTLSQHSANLP